MVPQVTPGMLDVYGYESHAISDGARALDWLGTSHYELILMDCQMANMDGFDATRAAAASRPA